MIDRILSSVPQSKKDAVVLGGGIHYDHDVGNAGFHSDVPIKTRPINKCERGQPQFVDLTNQKIGWFRVIGPFDGPRNSQKRARWVVRCVCGSYEVRTAKALKRIGNDKNQKCYKCQNLDFLKKRDADIQSGRYKAKIFQEVREGNSFSIGNRKGKD